MLKRIVKSNKTAKAGISISPAREALRKAEEVLAAARQKETAAQADVNRLQSIIDAVGPAQQKLQGAIAKDGGKALARYSAGNHQEKIGELITAVDAASRAALAARDALSEAERIAADARAGIARCDEEKRRRIHDVLIEAGDKIAERYRDCFNELNELHGELTAFAEGARLPGLILTSQRIEVPRFDLPSLQIKPLAVTGKGFSQHGLSSDEGYSPFLRYRTDKDRVNAQRLSWARFAAGLLSDVEAELGGQEASGVAVAPGLIRHQRQRAPEPSVNEVLYGGKR